MQKDGFMKKEYDFTKMKRRPGPVKVATRGMVKTTISLRMDPELMIQLRDESERVGIPYQTLIGSILHRYVTGQLVDAGTPDKMIDIPKDSTKKEKSKD